MAGQAPFALVYLGTVARDPQEMDEAMGLMLTYIYATLPNPPVYDDGARLSALAASPDGVDRISRLPDELLRNIVARLPVKDAARTTVLSSSWRALWPSTPLVLADGHLLPERQRWSPTPGNSPSAAHAVSRILEAHPGPFRCVHLVCSNMNAHRAELARWLHLLAAKGVQDLVLVNRPWPRDVPLPAMLFAITTLTRLYVGMWKLPDTAARALCGASFPHLRELGVCCVDMEHGVLDSLVARSPVLEVLNILECVDGLRLRIVSKSLRCVQISCSIMETIAVVKAPRLERLIHSSPCGVARRLPTRIEIGDAPKLHVFGFLEPRQVLQIRDTIITPGITSSTSTMVTSVKILSLSVRFEVRKEVKLVPAFLRCFPNVETLYIMSEKCDKPTGDYLTLEFWEESGPIENIHSCISMMSFKDFTGDPAEVGFLEFFCRRAGVLKTASIYLASPSFISFSKDEAFAKVRYSSRNRASKSCKITVFGCNGPLKGEVWRFKDGADFSVLDPFSTVDWRGSRWKP